MEDASVVQETLPLSFPSIHLAKRPGADNPVTMDCFTHTTQTKIKGTFTIHKKQLSNGQVEFYTEPTLPAGCVAVETLYLSVDPYLRCQFNEDTGVHYVQPFQIDQPVTSAGVGIVRVSNAANMPVGTVCGGDTFDWEWQTYQVFGQWRSDVPEEKAKLPITVPPPIDTTRPSLMLGALGVTGLTAYFGVMSEVDIKRGDVLVVSSAAGGTGSVACQLAKNLLSATVIGLTSTDEKCDFLTSSGVVDEAVNYKKHSANLADAITVAVAKAKEKSSLPKKDADPAEAEGVVNYYFDNVGGSISDDVVKTMAPNGQIILCGQISVYDDDVPYPPPIPTETSTIIAQKNIKRERYLVLNYAAEFPDAVAKLAGCVLDGTLVAKETVFDGLEKTPEAFLGVMGGQNVGKMIVKL